MLDENYAVIDDVEDVIKFIVMSANDYRKEYKHPDDYTIFMNSLKSFTYDQLKEIFAVCKPQEKRFFFLIFILRIIKFMFNVHALIFSR